MMKHVAAFAMAAVGLFAFTAPGTAQQYPSRTVTIICPYPAGGPTDQTARVIANFLSKKFGQNVIVENVTGGGTNIGTNRAVRAAPDGYTMLLHNLQISANPSLYKNLPFDTVKDLTAVMLVNNNPLVLVGQHHRCQILHRVERQAQGSDSGDAGQQQPAGSGRPQGFAAE